MQVNSSSCLGFTSTASSSWDRSAPRSKDSAASASSSSTFPEFLSCRRALSLFDALFGLFVLVLARRVVVSRHTSLHPHAARNPCRIVARRARLCTIGVPLRTPVPRCVP